MSRAAQQELNRGFSSVEGKRHSGKGKLIPPSVELRSPEYTTVWKGGAGEEEEWVGQGKEKIKLRNIGGIYSLNSLPLYLSNQSLYSFVFNFNFRCLIL